MTDDAEIIEVTTRDRELPEIPGNAHWVYNKDGTAELTDINSAGMSITIDDPDSLIILDEMR